MGKRKIQIPLFCISLFFLFFSYGFPEIRKSGDVSAERKIRLTWDHVEGAVNYRVMIRDTRGNVIVNKDTPSPDIELDIPPGSYGIRIGAVNKFGKIGSWSDWADITVKSPKVEEKEKEKEEEKKEGEERLTERGDLFGFGLKISAGMSYFYILPDWDKYFDDSFKSFSMNARYSFRYMKFPDLFKYTGIELETNYVSIEGISVFNRIESDLTDIITGVNIVIATNFDFPLNLAFRVGGGFAYTKQEYLTYDNMGNPADKGTAESADFFYKAGLSLEYRFYSSFFLEAFADYYSINYIKKPFNALRFSCQAGVRL
jgi:hypothetical protein